MSSELTIEELTAKLKSQLAKLEDNSIPLNEAMKVYREAAITLEQCYDSLDKAKGHLSDINEEIDNLRMKRDEL